MLELLQPLKSLLSRDPVLIDNIVFRLHCRVTVLILLTCSILISAKQYVGEPISCITDASIGKALILYNGLLFYGSRIW